jgi:hypothetical protein
LPFNVADCFDFHDNNTPRESKPVIFHSGAMFAVVVAAAPKRKAIAVIVKVARVIAPFHNILSLLCGEQKRQNPSQ